MDALLTAICRRSPVMHGLLSESGQESLFAYAKKFFDLHTAPVHQERRSEFVSAVRALLLPRLGQEETENVCAQLQECSLVSTTDHHAFIQHPYWINANIVTALPYMEAPNPPSSIVVFSFSSISLNNGSGFPRGLLFHATDDCSGDPVKLPIYPDKEKMGMVYAMRRFTADDLAHATHALQELVKKGEVPQARATAIATMMQETFGREDVLNAADLCAQITILNARVWPRLFHGSDGQLSHVPGLVYLEIERLVADLLCASHLQNSSSPVHSLLFGKDPERVSRLFDGITGMFCREKGLGSYLFWGIDQKLHRTALHLQDGALVSEDGTIRVEMTPDAIANALKTKTIMPGMGLCYILVAFHYGFTCLGGFCQVQDLTELKDAWVAFLRELGMQEEAETAQTVQTRDMSAGGMILAYLPTPRKTLVPATGLDLLLARTEDTRLERLASYAKHVTFRESMYPMLLDNYRVFYTAQERDPALLTFSSEHVTASAGLYQAFLSTHDL